MCFARRFCRYRANFVIKSLKIVPIFSRKICHKIIKKYVIICHKKNSVSIIIRKFLHNLFIIINLLFIQEDTLTIYIMYLQTWNNNFTERRIIDLYNSFRKKLFTQLNNLFFRNYWILIILLSITCSYFLIIFSLYRLEHFFYIPRTCHALSHDKYGGMGKEKGGGQL